MKGECFNWTFAGAPVSVDLDLGVVDSLKREIPGANQAERRGILVGDVTADSPIRVRITDSRPITGKNVRAALEECRANSRAPVGYYHLHATGPVRFDPEDLAVAWAWFNDPSRVFLVASAGQSGDAAAGFFFWDDGEIHSDFSFLEFPLNPRDLRDAPVPTALRANPRWALAGAAVVSVAALAALFTSGSSPPEPRPAVQSPRARPEPASSDAYPVAMVIAPANRTSDQTPKLVHLVRPALPPRVAALVQKRTRVQVKVSIDGSGYVVGAEPLATNRETRMMGAIVAAATLHWRFDTAPLGESAARRDVIVDVEFEPPRE